MNTKYTDSARNKSNLKNVIGTFAIEGIAIDKATRNNLERMSSGQISYQQIVKELRANYAQKS